MTDTFPWLDDIIRAARQGRLAVLTDVDGTISALAPAPDLAVVSPRARTALASLTELAVVVGAVSGRELDDLRERVGLPDLYYSGGHGISSWYRGVEERAPEAAPFAALTVQAMAELAGPLAGRAVRFEQKRFGVAIHYRGDPDPAAARAAVLAAIAASPAACSFSLKEGARVVELLPPLGITKATTIRRLVERFTIDVLLFFGDDITDADAFAALRELRAAGRITGAAVLAVHPETAAEAYALADVSVPAVEGVAAVLEALERGLSGERGAESE